MTNATELHYYSHMNTYKRTKIRSLILDFINTRTTPFDARELLAALRNRVVTVHKTTVYRELAFLYTHRIVREIDFGDGKKRYEGSHLPHHHHLICTNCATVEDIILGNELAHIERSIEKIKKFEIKKHALEFFGLCAQCSHV